MLSAKTISNTEEFLRLEGAWNRVLLQSEANGVFLTWAWISNWWKTYGIGKELRVIVVSDDVGEIVGIAPFYLRARKIMKRIPVREICLLGTGEDVSPDYLDFVIRQGREVDAVRAIFDRLAAADDWDAVNLTDMHEDSKVAGLILKIAPELGLIARRKACCTCPYILLPDSWEKFLAELSKNTRYNVKRRIRNLERDFTVKFYLWQDQATVPAAMERLAILHTNRWADRGTSRSWVSPEYDSFHQSVARDFAGLGWLHLSCLELNGEIAGMYYDYLYNNRIFYYQAGFDPAYKKYSPGLVLRAYVIRKAIEDGVREVDLLKGAYDFKYIWTKRSRSTVTVSVGKRNLAGRSYFFQNYDKPRLKALLKEHLPEPVLRIIR
jgi:CelD/BcsL family acetyltransferase involved in cellulose biosynthesis